MLDSEFDGPSYISSTSRNEAVVLRCRDTNLRLHGELEEEKNRKKELYQQVQSLESDLKATKAELQRERTQKAETEAKVSRLERRAADAEAQLQTQKHNRETTGDQLQKVKTEAIQKGQELFAKDLRISELEGAVVRAEARASAAEAEASRVTQELGAVNERLAAAESEAIQRRANIAAEAAKAERATQLCEERDKMCQALQQEVDSTKERLQNAEEARKRAEVVVAACREREAGLRRSLTERTADAEQSSLHLNTEVSDLRGRLLELETEATKQERLVGQLRSELSTSQSQQQSAQADYHRSSEALSAKIADLARVQVEFEASEQQVQRLTVTLKDERKDAQERWQALMDNFNAEKGKLQDKSHRDAMSGAESLQQQVLNNRQLSEELKETQEKMATIGNAKEKLITEVGQLQRQVGNLQHEHAQDMQKLQAKHKAETAELEHLLETRSAQHATHSAQLEASYQRVSSTLAECCTQQGFLEQQKVELEKSQNKVMQDHQEAHAQAAELTWRLDATNKELERSREALKTEHGKASHAKEVAQQVRHSLAHAEGEASKASELYAQSQRQAAQLKKELEQAQLALEQGQGRQSIELEQAREEVRARSISMMALEVKIQEMDARAASLAVTHRETISRMQTNIDAAESQASKEKHNSDMAESRAEGLFVERMRASEAAAAVKLRDVEAATQERLQVAELAAATQVKEMSAKLRETEDSHVAKTATAAAAFQAREAQVEAAAAKLAETKIEESKAKYEQKLSKLYRQLSEKQASEHKLKSVLKNEIDLLHQHDQEVDAYKAGRQSRKADKNLVEDFIADRMKGMAEKVERRVLRSLRHPQR